MCLRETRNSVSELDSCDAFYHDHAVVANACWNEETRSLEEYINPWQTPPADGSLGECYFDFRREHVGRRSMRKHHRTNFVRNQRLTQSMRSRSLTLPGEVMDRQTIHDMALPMYRQEKQELKKTTLVEKAQEPVPELNSQVKERLSQILGKGFLC